MSETLYDNICPFCEALHGSPFVRNDFQCGTEGDQHQSQITWRRSDKCYKRQLTQQAEQIATLELSLKSLQEHHEAQTKDWEGKECQQADLLRQALEMVLLQRKHLLACKPCMQLAAAGGFWEECDAKAQALIPNLEKVLEEVK